MKFLFLFLLIPSIALPQGQERKIFFYNIGFGGISGGIGAALNAKGEKRAKCFIRGFWQGSIGGMVNYSSKKANHRIVDHQNIAWAMPARLLNAAGNSIIQNAAFNEPFLKNWNFEYGPFHFDLALHGQHPLRVRLLPLSLAGAAFCIPKGKFDAGASLLTGIMIFRTNERINSGRSMVGGINYGRAFLYQDSSNKYHILVHEIIHEYQYREYLVINSFLKKPVERLKDTRLKKTMARYIYPDIPYFGLFYMLEGVAPAPKIYRNFFEFEAERIALGKKVVIE